MNQTSTHPRTISPTTSSSAHSIQDNKHLLLALDSEVAHICLHRLALDTIKLRKSDLIIDLDHIASGILENAEHILHGGVDVLRGSGSELAVFEEVGGPGEDVLEGDRGRVDGDRRGCGGAAHLVGELEGEEGSRVELSDRSWGREGSGREEEGGKDG